MSQRVAPEGRGVRKRAKKGPRAPTGVWAHFGQGGIWFEWELDGCQARRMHVVALDDHALAREVKDVARCGPGWVPLGGVSPTLARDYGNKPLFDEACAFIRGMLDRGGTERELAEMAGFTERNAYPVMRSRRERLSPALLAAVASLYGDGVQRKELAERLGHPESTVQTWIRRARLDGYLSRNGRQVTPEGRAVLDQDRREPEEIVAAWSGAA
jgi:hypothetical protein